MENRYTIEDCFVLQCLISATEGSFAVLDFYDEVIDKAREKLKTQELKEDDIEKWIRAWLLKTHFNKAYIAQLFLYEVPFENVALYINNERLSIFVQWRLKIAK